MLPKSYALLTWCTLSFICSILVNIKPTGKVNFEDIPFECLIRGTACNFDGLDQLKVGL